jgi:hypothetical protein
MDGKKDRKKEGNNSISIKIAENNILDIKKREYIKNYTQ